MKQSLPSRRGSGHSPTDLGLHGKPLDCLSDDDLREPQICAVIDTLATARSFDRQAGGAGQIEAMQLLPELRAILTSCLDSGFELAADDRAFLLGFTGHVRRHLVAETAVLLPICPRPADAGRSEAAVAKHAVAPRVAPFRRGGKC
jgi:hypothetical protein